nr:hypothetical protein [Brevibacillus laterosporus]
MGIAAKKRKTLHDMYHDGSKTVEEFLDKLLNSKDGDRKRRRIEESHNRLFSQQKTNKSTD